MIPKNHVNCTDCNYIDIIENFTVCYYCSEPICNECFYENQSNICISCILHYNNFMNFEEVITKCPKCDYSIKNDDNFINCVSCSELACENCCKSQKCSQCISNEYFTTLKKLTNIKII